MTMISHDLTGDKRGGNNNTNGNDEINGDKIS